MEKIDLNNKKIIISRTDSIGDVILTLPICDWIKKHFPSSEIIFLCKTYTIPIVESYQAIDHICDWNELESLPTVERLARFRKLEADAIIHVFPNREIANLAKKVKIPHRIGTSHRSYHLLTCNHRLNFTRKRSDKHEAQLNFELLKPFGLKELPTMETLVTSTKWFNPPNQQLPERIEKFIQEHPDYIILHPKSQGSALEWPIEKYVELSKQLNQRGIAVAYTGTEKEGNLIRENISENELTIDTTGTLDLYQLMTFIQSAKGIVACSTGPLHIGGFLGVKTVGLYSSRIPIHPGRWQAIGKDAHYVVYDENCSTCSKKQECTCIEKISPEKVLDMLLKQE